MGPTMGGGSRVGKQEIDARDNNVPRKPARLGKPLTLEVKGAERQRGQQAWCGCLGKPWVPFSQFRKTAAMAGLGGHMGNLNTGLEGWGIGE